ncbi:MAG TPA: hypothetical protein VHX44_19340, partial [Planctomycetota bacterium]|nr:hypothetical protein [Planctomycetota bacterium]
MRAVVPLVFLLLGVTATLVAEERVLRVYDVADLLEAPCDLPPPVLGSAATVTPEAQAAPTPRMSDPITPDAFLRATFEPGLVALIDENGEWRGGHVLSLNTTADLHRQVERTLATA